MQNIDGLTDSQRIILLRTKEMEQDDMLYKHHKILIEGEGDQIPLVEKVRNLEVFTGSLKFWLRTVAVSIVLQTITFGVAALVYFIKVYQP